MTAYPRQDLIEAFITRGYSPDQAASALATFSDDGFWQYMLDQEETAQGAVNAYLEARHNLLRLGLIVCVPTH